MDLIWPPPPLKVNTICQKGRQDGFHDVYHLCHCYNSTGGEVRDEHYTPGNKDKVTHYCCQCPKMTNQREYKQFKVRAKAESFSFHRLIIFFSVRKSRLETALRNMQDRWIWSWVQMLKSWSSRDAKMSVLEISREPKHYLSSTAKNSN